MIASQRQTKTRRVSFAGKFCWVTGVAGSHTNPRRYENSAAGLTADYCSDRAGRLDRWRRVKITVRQSSSADWSGRGLAGKLPAFGELKS
jgi:hypothetical protein